MSWLNIPDLLNVQSDNYTNYREMLACVHFISLNPERKHEIEIIVENKKLEQISTLLLGWKKKFGNQNELTVKIKSGRIDMKLVQ